MKTYELKLAWDTSLTFITKEQLIKALSIIMDRQATELEEEYGEMDFNIKVKFPPKVKEEQEQEQEDEF